MTFQTDMFLTVRASVAKIPQEFPWHTECLGLGSDRELQSEALTGLVMSGLSSPGARLSWRETVGASANLLQSTRRVRGRAWHDLQNTPPRPW
jgi:hypothetical protein